MACAPPMGLSEGSSPPDDGGNLRRHGSTGQSNTSCTIVNFRHFIKAGGTTVRGWMVDVAVALGWGLQRHDERMFCAHFFPGTHMCRPSGFPIERLDSNYFSRLNSTGFLVESHTYAHFFTHLMHERALTHPTNVLAPPSWPAHAGCKIIVAVLWREPASCYHSWYRYLLDMYWGDLHIAYAQKRGCIVEGKRCRRSVLPFDAWLFNRTGDYRRISLSHGTPIESPIRGALPNLQSEQFIYGRTPCALPPCPHRDHQVMLQLGRRLLRHVDLAGVTEDMGGFLLLLCDLLGLITCPRYVSFNLGDNRSKLSSRFPPSAVSEHMAHYVRTKLAPLDQVLYTETLGHFNSRKQPFAHRISAYKMLPPQSSVAEWHACAAQSNAFEQGLRVGAAVRAKNGGEQRSHLFSCRVV